MKKTSILLCLVMLLSLCGCGGTADKKTKEFFAMDTYMTLTAYGDNAEKALSEAQSEVERLDSLLNAEDKHSEIYRLNCEKKLTLSEETSQVLKKALDFSELTDGVFNPALHPLMKLWGFTTKDYTVPSAEEIKNTLKLCDVKNVALNGQNAVIKKDGTELDLGGIAKGYTSSRLIEILKKNGIESGLVNLGGNVQTLGKKPDGSDFTVAIESPEKDGGYLGMLKTSGKAVITSGDYERFFEKNGKTYHHIMNPETGYPAESGLASVTIVSKDGTLADALSTLLYVMGEKKAVEFWNRSSEDFDIILFTKDNKLIVSGGIADSFTSEYNIEVIKKD